MLRTKTLLWWIPAIVVATIAVAEGGRQIGAARAAKGAHTSAVVAGCPTRQIDVDVDGNGTLESVRIVRVGGDAWADVWSGTQLLSSTRVGAWRDDAMLEALDVNGDGKIDVVRRWAEGPEQHAQVWLSDGRAFDEGWSGVTGNTCVAQAEVAKR
ncbi:MAG TPA: hypothetical protein VGL86_06110 [Polyangia bacterium]|jgi:hypothetical protein